MSAQNDLHSRLDNVKASGALEVQGKRPLTPAPGDSKARTELAKTQLRSFNPAMVSQSVNKTALHPGGVQPTREHTELEEELHAHAHIDYDRVAIIANPSVAALYEDALVYETGSAMTSTGALTAYSGAKTGRSPSDKRVVKEPGSENDVWWGPVNKEMSPEVSHAHSHSHYPKVPLQVRGKVSWLSILMISNRHFESCCRVEDVFPAKIRLL